MPNPKLFNQRFFWSAGHLTYLLGRQKPLDWVTSSQLVYVWIQKLATGKNDDRKEFLSVMITQKMCPIRAEISTHKHLEKCIYLLFVWLAIIGFRQNYFYILPNFGEFGAKMSFFHYIIKKNLNNFIKHCPPPRTRQPLISEMCIYIRGPRAFYLSLTW